LKRMLICAGLVVTLVLPATTEARARSFHGSVRPDGSVEFEARFRHGKPNRVKGSPHHPGFAWKGVPIECETGSLPLDSVWGHLPFSIEVVGRRFHAKGSNGNAIANLRGRFRRHGTRARGTLRVHGDFPRMDASNCDTGRSHWLTHRAPA
jgi:hypothetical protein